MWPDRVSNQGPPTYESGALPIALRGPARKIVTNLLKYLSKIDYYEILKQDQHTLDHN